MVECGVVGVKMESTMLSTLSLRTEVVTEEEYRYWD
jgi:hypothetical protein